MSFFPAEYSKPELIDIVKAADLGWSAFCGGGSNPSTSLFTCEGGGAPQKPQNSTLFQNSGSGESSSSRLINPGDVSHGL